MKTLHHMLVALSLGATAALSAQTADTPVPGPRGPHGSGAPGPGSHYRYFHGGPGLAVVRAIDSDKNRELSAAELANAPDSLRALDANADGVVARDELRLHPQPDGRKGPPGIHQRRPSEARERPADAPDRPAHLRQRSAEDSTERPLHLRRRPTEDPSGQPGPRHLRIHREPGRIVDPVMLALDADKDGALSESEVANATASLNALDLDKDGKLVVDELRPLPPEE